MTVNMKIYLSNRNVGNWLLAVALILIFWGGIYANAETIDGFVTKINSQTEFNVGTFQVSVDAQTRCITGRTFLGEEPPKAVCVRELCSLVKA